MGFEFKRACDVGGIERAFFEDGKGNMMICTLGEVVAAAADPTRTSGLFTTGPTQQQAQQALTKLGLQMG